MKSGLRPVPFARGGRKNLYNPTAFTSGAVKLVRLGVDAAALSPACRCSNTAVESIVMDHEKNGTVVTLVNWDNAPIDALEVTLKRAEKPRSVRSVEKGRDVKWTYADGAITFTTSLAEADFILVK